MGFLSGLLPLAGSVVGNMIVPGIGGAVGGGIGGLLGGGSTQSGTQTVTQQQQLDPRISQMLFGDNNNGLLSKYQGLLDAPQSEAMKNYGQLAGDYLGTRGANDLNAMHDSAARLLNPTAAPQMTAALAGAQPGAAGMAATGAQAGYTGQGDLLWNKGESVNAPSQNGLDLKNAYNGMIYGDPAANPYLTGAIAKGINQSTNAFNAMQDSATNNLMKTVLPSIRSNSVLAGQYGGSRQGIAEGNAIGDYAKAAQQAAAQFGQNNTDAAVAAQAGAFDAGQNRALSAMQGLGAQQYGVAGQNSAQAQQANLANQAAGNNAAQFNANAANSAMQNNAALAQNNGQFNAGLGQANNQFNATLGQNNAQFNAGQQQAANAANLQSQLGTNSMNNAATLGGIGALSGLLGNAYSTAGAQDNYALNRAQGVNNLLAPYLSANQRSTTSQPLYSNPAGNALGGALAGYGLAKNVFGSGSAGGLFDLFGSGSSFSGGGFL